MLKAWSGASEGLGCPGVEVRQEGLGELRVVGADALDAYFGFAEQTDLLGCGVGEIDDGAGLVGPTIVDANEGGFAVVQVGDAEPAAEGEGWVRAGEGVHVEALAGGGALALKGAAVPGGDTCLEPVVVFRFCLGGGGRSRRTCKNGCRCCQSQQENGGTPTLSEWPAEVAQALTNKITHLVIVSG